MLGSARMFMGGSGGFSTYRGEILKLSPLAYWRLDDLIGSTITSETLDNYPATYINNPTLETVGLLSNDINKAVNFNGVDQRVKEDLLDLTDGIGGDKPISFSLLANVNTFGANKGGLLSKWTDTAVDDAQMSITFLDSGVLNVQFLSGDVNDRVVVETVDALVTGTTYHIVITYDGLLIGNGVKIYINGNLSNVTYTSVGTYVGMSNATADAPFMIGVIRYTDSVYKRFFDGIIDEVAVHDKELNQVEITNIYDVAANPTYNKYIMALSPLAYWRLGELVGNTIAVDETNNANGTYNGSPTLETTGLLVGDSNTAVFFDNTNDYVSVDNIATLIQPATVLSVSLLFKTNSVPGAITTNVAYSINTANGDANIIRIGTGVVGGIYISVGSGADIEYGSGYNDNLPHSLVVTFDIGNTGNIYVDGVNIATHSQVTPDFANSAISTIGGEYDPGLVMSDFFDGVIDEVSVFKSILSGAEVLNIYKKAK